MFDKIKSWFVPSGSEQYKIVFGRYTDSFKSKEQVAYWNKALELGVQGKYLESYEQFFSYLLDPAEDNVLLRKSKDSFGFTIYQGSAEIVGEATANRLIAEVVLAQFEKPNLAVMRRLLEKNYSLRYSRYAIQDNKLILKFDAAFEDAGPEKLYFALKEVAVRADKEDDLLITDFRQLNPIKNAPKVANTTDASVKYDFLKKWISETLIKSEQLEHYRDEKSIAYLMAKLALRIDYLLTPQGKLMESNEKVLQHFMMGFLGNLTSSIDKMTAIWEDVLRRDKDILLAELYNTKATFGLANATAHSSVIELINGEQPKLNTYIEKNKKEQALNHLEYIALYALFNYGMRLPTRQILNLLVEICNRPFVEKIPNRRSFYEGKTDQLNEDVIIALLKEIEDGAQKEHPGFALYTKELNFENVLRFGSSLLDMIKRIKYV